MEMHFWIYKLSDDVVAIIRIAELFNVVLLDVIDRLTNQKIESIRKKGGRSHQEKWVRKEISIDKDWRKNTTGADLLSRGVNLSHGMPELEAQLLNKTGQHILTIPLGKTEPALYRIS
jgi:hypothetical protein